MPKFAVNHLSGTRPRWHISNVLAQIDIFGRNIPTFTLKGQEMFKTAIGGLFTIVMLITVAMYGAKKTQHLINKTDPTVSSTTIPDAIKTKEIINIGKSNFRFAFSLESQGETKNDSKFVQWHVRTYGKRNGKQFENMLSIHRCTDEDMSEFYPISK